MNEKQNNMMLMGQLIEERHYSDCNLGVRLLVHLSPQLYCVSSRQWQPQYPLGLHQIYIYREMDHRHNFGVRYDKKIAGEYFDFH